MRLFFRRRPPLRLRGQDAYEWTDNAYEMETEGLETPVVEALTKLAAPLARPEIVTVRRGSETLLCPSGKIIEGDAELARRPAEDPFARVTR